ncbi:hypothetical protein NVS89_15235 [Ancylobacter sp. MQZ15Z-1]|uniref:Uncharacterized protein n=1 Tax=Ancylobacter mangrovi TaxID=2972472 RepID=A0A9X2PCZ5_9HYPH|nr:hypothetical protein [Ancylobacter mangrovi]MCS0496454.1 hypothetical protein [Ancylobacter mangrovi]
MFSLATAALAATIGLVLWSLAGYRLARRLGFGRAFALPVAPALGWAAQNVLALALAEMIGFSALAILASLALILVSTLPTAATEGAEDDELPPWWIAPAAGLLALVPALAVVPKHTADGVILAAAIFDHSKIALIDEMLRTGVPPVNPFYGPVGQPAEISYYYLWHFGAAQIARLAGATGWEADAAASWFTAFSTALLMAGLALRLGGNRLAPALALALCATGSLRPLLGWLAGAGLDQWLAPATGLAGWLFQTSWSPHHVAAAGSLVIAALLGVRLARRPDAPTCLVLALVMAAAFQSSFWVGGVVLALVALAFAPLLVCAAPARGRVRFVLAAAVAGLLALAFAAPLLLAQYHAALGRGGGSPVALRAYEVLGPLLTGQFGRVLDLPAYWLLLLPVEFPLVVIAGALTLLCRIGAPDEAPRRLEVRALALVAAVSFATSWLLVSTVGDNNDLGWRAVLPGLMVLTAAAAAGLAGLVARRARLALVAALALFAASLPAGAIILAGNAGGDASLSAAAFARAPAMWAAVRRAVPPQDRIASNPALFADMTPWPVNISWALLADRRSCFAGKELAIAFAPLAPAAREAISRQFLAVFDGRAGPDDVHALAERYDCRAVLVTARDGAWTRDPFAVSPDYRLVETEPDAWRLYRATAPASSPTVRP